jgi:hypothetical protein
LYIGHVSTQAAFLSTVIRFVRLVYPLSLTKDDRVSPQEHFP